MGLGGVVVKEGGVMKPEAFAGSMGLCPRSKETARDCQVTGLVCWFSTKKHDEFFAPP